MFAAFIVPPMTKSVVSLDRAPVIRPLLVVQVSDTSNMRRVAVCFRPIDCFFLCAKSAKHLVTLGLDHIIIDARPLGAAFRPGFNVHGCYNLISLLFCNGCLSCLLCVEVGLAVMAESPYPLP